MQLIRNLDAADNKTPTAVAIGNFDGLHRGHARVIEAMLTLANANGLVPAVLTFEPHPRRYFAPHAPLFRLETLKQKIARLRAWGVARIYMPRFNAVFAAQSAEAFLQTVLQRQLNARAIVTGENFVFGAKRAGNVTQLSDWGTNQGIIVHAVSAVVFDGIICSSSAVREALTHGDMVRANALLGRYYQLCGRVMHGDARGRQLGFPTANIALAPGLRLPAYGVYAIRVELYGKNYTGVANLGVRPTIGGTSSPRLEVHIFGFDSDIYGVPVSVELIRWIRPEKQFVTLDALKAQIASDCEAARSIV